MKKITKLNCVNEAESVIKSLIYKGREGKEKIDVTSSQLRNLLALVNNLRNQMMLEQDEKISEELQSEVQYVKMKFTYAAGKDNKVKIFLEKADMLSVLGDIGDSREKLESACRYMESLIAYHKFYGGRER